MKEYRIFFDEWQGYYVAHFHHNFWQQVSRYTPYKKVAERYLNNIITN